MTMRRTRGAGADARCAVEVCFGCGALVDHHSRDVVEIRWGAENPGRDQVVGVRRSTRATACMSCIGYLENVGGLVSRVGNCELHVVKAKDGSTLGAGAGTVVVCDGKRRRVK